jgi:hypothetical protein
MRLSLIKHKAVVGARFVIGGRLTRRNIAAKSVFKVGQVGSLKILTLHINKCQLLL